MAHGDRQAGLGGQGGEFGLPQPPAVAVAPSAVISSLAACGWAADPAAAHQEPMVLTANAQVSWIGAHRHPAGVGGQVMDAVGVGLAEVGVFEVVYPLRFGAAYWRWPAG